MVCHDNNVFRIASGYAFFQELQAFVMLHVETNPIKRIAISTFYTPEIGYSLLCQECITLFDIRP